MTFDFVHNIIISLYMSTINSCGLTYMYIPNCIDNGKFSCHINVGSAIHIYIYIRIRRNKYTTALDTLIGLYVKLEVPEAWANQTKGLCGNNNGNNQDDKTLQTGALATDAAAFGNSWRVSPDKCVEYVPTGKEPCEVRTSDANIPNKC